MFSFFSWLSSRVFFCSDTNCGRMAERKSCIFTCKTIIIIIFFVNPLTVNPTKWSNTLPTNCLSVFNHFVGLALKGLKIMYQIIFHAIMWLEPNAPKLLQPGKTLSGKDFYKLIIYLCKYRTSSSHS